MAEDPEFEAVRRAIAPGTTKSIKRTLCACMLIRAARRPSTSTGNERSLLQRRTKVALATATPAAIAAVHWWPAISSMLHHIGLLCRRHGRGSSGR